LWYLLYEALTETTTAQPIMLSYPLLLSILSPGGIDRNKTSYIISDIFANTKQLYEYFFLKIQGLIESRLTYLAATSQIAILGIPTSI